MRRLRTVGVALALVATTMSVVTSGPSAADQNEGSTPALIDAQRLVAVGGLHTCAVMDNGVVRCWGDNANGQLGNGTRAVSTEPKPVAGLTDAVTVAAGNAHTCALRKNATVTCWGLNSNGQIGSDSVMVNSSTTPRPVPGLAEVRAIAAGGFHNCALLDTGRVSCWGLDGAGQLGDGDGTPAGETATPVEVTGITNASAIAAGEFHTCALLTTGGVQCWGHNGFGQLGNDSTADSTAPVAVKDLPDTTDPDNVKKALAITAGYGHSCAVVDDSDPSVRENTVRCWGNNNQGQLGDGTTTDRDTPVTAKIDIHPNLADSTYLHVPLTGADIVTAGQQHTCARTFDGTNREAWCWGNAGRGQIGDGTRGEGDVNPTLPEEGAGSEKRFMWRSARHVSAGSVDAVTAGGFHTCALSGSAMQCWGYNFYGQLGSYRGSSNVPVTVTALQGAASVATGTDAACARVLVPGQPNTHQPVCWGTNEYGELGARLANPPTAGSTVPVQVFGQTDVASITAGNGHACALPTTPTGVAAPLCWGTNDDGQLGNGTTAGSTEPVPVSGSLAATQISAGGRELGGEIAHTCARLDEGTARCWGENADGQLGDNSPPPPATTQSTSPVTVIYDADPDPLIFDPQPLPDVVQVAAGGSHSCALRTDTTVWCWGRNNFGQLGDNTTSARRLATQVKLVDDPAEDPPLVYLDDVVAITAGMRHTCALMGGTDEPGRVRCWGANDRGQLGTGWPDEKHLPTLVAAIGDTDHGAVAITAGMSHTCAIVDNASARCWGDNASGQLGNGGAGFSLAPVTPVGLDDDTADTIRGELPDNDLPQPQPEDLVTSLSAGKRNTCASLIDMTVSCWGSNSDGQLGDGVGPSRITPISVEHLDDVPGEGVNGNKSPAATDDAASTTEDPPSAVVTNVTGNDSDPDGDAVSVLQVKDPAHGTASGSGTNVTYTPDPDYCGTDTVSYRIFDGRNGVADAVLTVTIGCVNDAPMAVDDAVTTAEDTAVTVAVLANDTDPDTGAPDPATSDVLTVVGAGGPLHGTTTVVAGGVKYEPAADYTGGDSFTYEVQDGTGATDTATVSVTVTAANDPPVALDDEASTPEDSAITVPVLANDSDIDGDALSVSALTQPAHGTTVAVAGGVKYTPAPDYTGPDSFNYSANDGRGGTDPATVSVTVSPVQDAPVANDDTMSTRQDQIITVPVLANDTDADGQTLTVQSVTQPSHGTAAIEAGGIKYTPAAGYVGQDSFTYVATDGTATDSALVSITVSPGNYPPFAGDDMVTTAEDTPVTVGVLANDFDPDGDAMTVSVIGLPAHGATEVVAGGIRYTPAPNYWGTDSFTYRASDGNGGMDTAAVAVTVTAVSDAPDAVDDAASTAEDTPMTVAVLANDIDADGDVLSVTLLTQPTHGSAAIVAGGVKYTPVANYAGPDSFTYSVSDGNGGSDTATVSLTVTPVNDAPTLDPIADQTAPWGSEVIAFATGHDVDSAGLAYSLVSAPAAAAVSAEGTITWTPAANDIGVRAITVRVSDGAASADRSFRVTVTRQPTSLTYDPNPAPAGQHSDPVGLSARLTGTGGAPVEGATVSFAIGGQSSSASTGPDGKAATVIVLTGSPGATSASASFAGSAAYEPAATTRPFTIDRESAAVTVTGPSLVLTAGTAAPATLTASVQEEPDGSPGSALGSAQVRFTDLSGTTLCTGGVTSASPGTGTASCTTTSLSLSSRGVVAQLLSPAYTARVDVAALTVASVAAGAAAGGGSVTDGTSQRADFGFRATPAKRGAPTGEAVQVFRQVADLAMGDGTRPYAFVVRTSTLTSLTTSCSGKSVKVCTATVQGTGATTVAVDLDTGAVITVPGSATIRVDATDNAEPSGGSVPADRYAASVVGPRSFSVGGPTDQRLLTAGNIRIPA